MCVFKIFTKSHICSKLCNEIISFHIFKHVVFTVVTFSVVVLEIEPRLLRIPGDYFTTKLQLQAWLFTFE